jgi:hypothetical protein
LPVGEIRLSIAQKTTVVEERNVWLRVQANCNGSRRIGEIGRGRLESSEKKQTWNEDS